MTWGDVASRGRAVLIDRLCGKVAEARVAEGRSSAVRVRTQSGRSIHIKVSTKTAGTWQSTKSLRNGLADRDPNRLWAFVSVGKVGEPVKPTVFLAYEADLFRDIDRDVQEWFERNGHTDPSVKDVGHAAISEKRVYRMAQTFDKLIT